MRKQHENKFTMYHSVSALLEQNSEIVNANAGLTNKTIEFDSKCKEIKEFEEVRRTATTGRAVAKMRAKNKAITGCFAVTAGIFALANSSKDAELEEISDLQRSRLLLMRDTELIEVLESVHAMALARLDQLETHGVTSASLESYKQTVEAYSKAFGRSQTGTSNRKFATTNIPQLFREGDTILHQIDKYVDGLREDEKEFVSKYFSARVIRKLGIRHIKDPIVPDSTTPEGNGTPLSPPENNSPPVTS